MKGIRQRRILQYTKKKEKKSKSQTQSQSNIVRELQEAIRQSSQLQKEAQSKLAGPNENVSPEDKTGVSGWLAFYLVLMTDYGTGSCLKQLQIEHKIICHVCLIFSV